MPRKLSKLNLNNLQMFNKTLNSHKTLIITNKTLTKLKVINKIKYLY